MAEEEIPEIIKEMKRLQAEFEVAVKDELRFGEAQQIYFRIREILGEIDAAIALKQQDAQVRGPEYGSDEK